jgi:hypothetical protein
LIQSAAVNAARFDHDPVTLACKGLLIEESRTNLLTNSNFVGWGGTGIITVTPNSVDVGVAPDGSYPTKIECTISGNVQLPISVISGVTYTNSVYARSLSGGVLIRIGGIVPGLTTGYPTTNLFSRYDHVSTSATTGSRFFILTMLAGEIIYVWGAQAEAGSFATSYIPTTTGTAVRSADVCSITGSAFTGFYNQEEGTLFANIQSTGTGDRRPVAFDIGNNSQAYWFYSSTTLNRYAQANGPLGSFNINGTIPSAPLRYAGTIKDGDYSLALNGSIVGSSSATLGRTDTAMRIGGGGGGGAQLLCGHIAAIRYYKKRLPNTKLQTITV